MSLRKYTKEWLEELCKDSNSYSEVLRKAGRAQAGGSQALLKKKIAEWKIDVSHFEKRRWTGTTFLCPNCHAATENYGGKKNIGQKREV